jgi:ABC-type thiamine transport system substrate-binding protein
MEKRTAVEWLKPQIELMLMDGYKSYPNELEEVFKIAKEMEKQQQDELAIDFIKWTISQEADNLIHDLQMVGEVSKFPSTEEVLKVYKRFKNL